MEPATPGVGPSSAAARGVRPVSREVEVLGRRVRGHVLAHYGGRLLGVVAALLVPPAAVAALAGEMGFLVRCLGTAALLLLLAWPLARTPAPQDVQTHEGMVIGAGVFLVAALAMSVPMASAGLPWIDVFFECISGVTTTGLTALSSVEGHSPAFLFTRAWMQWFGGLGIAVFALVFLTRPGTVAHHLLVDAQEQDLVGSTQERGRRILRLYLAMSLVAVLVLVLVSGSAWDGLLYALAALSTGGFSPHADSLAGLNGAAAAAVLFLCMVGAVLHPFYRLTRRPRWREVAGDLQLHALLALTLLLALGLLFSLRFSLGLEWSEALVEAPVLAATAQTTAGFSRLAPGEIDGLSKLLVMGGMFVGGGIGSTAGGVKILRLLVLLRAAQALLARTSLPRHAVLSTWLGGRPLEEPELREAMLVILLFLAVLAASWLPFVAAGHEPLDALFDVVSALGTVGLSTGVVGPGLPGYLKGILCADMLLGRLEIVAWLVVLRPRTWIGR